MKIIVETAVKRKVTVIMATIAVLVFGVISLMRLKTNLLPELTYPSITVKTEIDFKLSLILKRL
jgi:HAE1 family hydrophobic/amphiphilic exporter-1